jgi:hypothetical protein
MIPLVVTRAQVEALRARGMQIVENSIALEERKSCVFPEGVDLLLHVLSGLDLTSATHIVVTVLDEDTGNVMNVVPDAPFDPISGEILIACQKHFATYPPNVVFEVRAEIAGGEARRGRYVVPHLYSGLPNMKG